MDREALEREVFNYYHNGFCCSEAISRTIVDRFADDPEGFPVKAASGFCGGVGRSREDICGALAGGVVAAGYLLGRTEPGRDMNEVARVVAAFRKAFLAAFGSTNCGVILKSLGEQENAAKCKQLTARAAGLLADILAGR